MSEIVVLLLMGFALLLAMNVPIAVAIAGSTYLCVLASGGDGNYTIAAKMANGIDSFTLLAIPFFILSGLFMGQGGIARRLMDFAAALVGRFPGGLAYVNTITCMLFGSISGSATAAVSSVGGFMIPEMNRKGYPREFNVALTTASATTGLIIPPSNIMIVYAVAAGSVSILGLFLAGILPGLVVGFSLMAVCGVWAKITGMQGEAAVAWKVVWTTFLRAAPCMFLVIIVIGGILGGIFTATEAAAIAVAYAFVLAVLVYREVKVTEIPGILLNGAVTTAVVMFLIGASSGMSWLLTTQNIPQEVSAALLTLSENPVILLLAINVLLLVVGTFMDMTPAVLIFTPIFLPVVTGLGMSEYHFGILLITNLCIGLCTPPVGTCLFVGCGVGKTTIARVTPALIPFFIAMVFALMLITFVPEISTWLPRMLEP
jgi:tripartite ATP-independent transporter DctM subunit